MTHQEIIDREIVEQYVLDQLSAGDRRIFQEHFFECDDCFQQAHNLSENLTRVRYAPTVLTKPLTNNILGQ